MKLFLFDDETADGWRPFALTRPAGELLFGTLRLRERLERWADATAAAHLIRREGASAYAEPGAPPARRPADVDGAGDGDGGTLLLLSRFVPDRGDGLSIPDRDRGAVLRHGERVVGAYLPPGRSLPDPEWTARPGPLDDAAAVDVGGRVLEEVWELVTRNPEQLERDLEGTPLPWPEAEPADAIEVVGDRPALAAGDVQVEPGVVADTRPGPVLLGPGVEVTAGTRLEGPLYVGPHSRLLGGKISCSAAGPYCYLHGEVEESVVLGYTNKSHHGFLGHSYLGRWVNLGAGTTNSDLKNNYSPVRIAGPYEQRDTGVLKLGVFLGDHAKTGIGTMLTGGTVMGAGSNVFGGTVPKWVPPFSWGRGEDLDVHRRRDFLETASRVLPRRDVEPTEDVREWLAAAWDEARG